MSARQIRITLKSLAVLLCAGTAGVAWWAWQGTPTSSSEESVVTRTPSRARVESGSSGVAIDEFSEVWTRSLRGPLYDPPQPRPRPVVQTTPKPKPVQQPPPPPQLDLRLVGTILESGRSQAILADASGKLDLKGTGEVLELEPSGVRVEDIEADAVTVSFDGRESKLKMAKAKGAARTKRRNRQ